ncbi:hypothetical protein HDU98_002080 [Podochytrium sp. JEL0797]|nr:hypothetical protein HDU98_002080 [Podochytrium sp. JEL0797]
MPFIETLQEKIRQLEARLAAKESGEPAVVAAPPQPPAILQAKLKKRTTTTSSILATAYPTKHQATNPAAGPSRAAPPPRLPVAKKPRWEDEVVPGDKDESFVDRLQKHQREFKDLNHSTNDRSASFARSIQQSSVANLTHTPHKPRYASSSDPTVEAYSGLRLKNRLIENKAFAELLAHRQYIPLTSLSPDLTDADVSGDWVTVAVVVNKSDPKLDSQKKNFVLLHLGDLRPTTTAVNAFLFGKVYEKLEKRVNGGVRVGDVVAVLNPTILSRMDKQSAMGISIDDSGKLLTLGESLDMAACKYASKDAIPKTCFTAIDGTGSMHIGSPTKQKKGYSHETTDAGGRSNSVSHDNGSAGTYLCNGGIQVSTSGDNRTNLLRPVVGGIKGVQPLTTELEAQIRCGGTRGDKNLRASRNLAAKKRDLSKVFSFDALQRLGYDPLTGNDVILAPAGGNSGPSSPAKKATKRVPPIQLDQQKIRACLAKGLEIPKECFGGVEEILEILCTSIPEAAVHAPGIISNQVMPRAGKAKKKAPAAVDDEDTPELSKMKGAAKIMSKAWLGIFLEFFRRTRHAMVIQIQE